MVRVYTQKNCPFCTEIKDLLVKEGIEFKEVDINSNENHEEVDKVFELTEADSVPILRVGNKLLAPDVSFGSINEAFTLTKQFLKD